MKRFLTRLSATFFFTGHFPIAPATFASLVTLGIWLLLPPIPSAVMIAVILFLCVFGVYVSGKAELIYGHDAKEIVIDEVVGALITILFFGHTLHVAVAGFLLFRVLDIVKPPPAYQFQSFRGGLGVVADDVMAGIYGNLLLRLIHMLWPGVL